jgi:hypothetical protein
VVVAIVLLGCGSDPRTVSQADVLAKGDAICRHFYDEALAAGNAGLSEHAYNVRVASLERAQIAALSSLGTPDHDAQAFRDMLVTQRVIRADLLAYIHRRSHPRDQQLEAARHEMSYRQLAKRFGFKVCSTMD